MYEVGEMPEGCGKESWKGFNNGISVNFYKLLYFYKFLWYIYLMYVFNAGGGFASTI